MDIKIKRLNENAVIPKYAKAGDAGADIVATSKNNTKDYVEYGTGLGFEIPPGFVGLLVPRSSLSNKDLILANHIGIIDSGFRGEVTFRFKRYHSPANTYEYNHNDYNIGDRIGQIVIIPYPKITFIETDSLSSSERGTGGYGHSGK